MLLSAFNFAFLAPSTNESTTLYSTDSLTRCPVLLSPAVSESARSGEDGTASTVVDEPDTMRRGRNGGSGVKVFTKLHGGRTHSL